MFDKYQSFPVSEGGMGEQATVVLDVGKTLTKLSLWAPDGSLITQCNRANERVETGRYVALDVGGIERFVADCLREFATLTEVGTIIPVGHGAAAAILDEQSGLVLPPLDYEHPIPASIRHAYDEQRDPFAFTGSPALPDGLNLGAQLFFLESLQPGLFLGQRRIVPWAQYWSWVLSGVAAAEVTSLGCHTDLWRPLARMPSQLAIKRGWSDHLAPLHDAGSVLGPLRSEWVERTGLSPKVRVHCGLHDSNAALLAARVSREILEQESTTLSTGTWFVAMRTPGRGARVNISRLDEKRDCLVNADVGSNPVPSARFMGGREIELLTGLDTRRIDIGPDQPALLAGVPAVLASKAMVLPTLAPGCGPFPHGRGRWISMPRDETQRRAAVALYAALVADVALKLIGARERLVIEGRFSESQVFVRALASLRPDMRVYICHSRSDVAYGALSLIASGRQSPAPLVRVNPLAEDLSEYRERWRVEAERMEQASL
jgi:sugar (pentulose or hexulose) kinase